VTWVFLGMSEGQQIMARQSKLNFHVLIHIVNLTQIHVPRMAREYYRLAGRLWGILMLYVY